MCVYFAEPKEVLSRKSPPPPSADFFDKVRFLIEGDKSVQSYSKPESYDRRRAAVIRGRVVTSSGEGIIGVRVSVDKSRGASNYGFTLTRPGGWFDLLVNGGGAVTLQFQRSPFKPLTRTSNIPWNQIFVMEAVVMSSNGGAGISWDEEESSLQLGFTSPCLSHNDSMAPIIVSDHSDLHTPQHGHDRMISTVAMVDTGSLVQSVNIPGTNTQLVYSSSPSSSLTMLLTPDTIPANLVRIHVKITIAGVVVTRLLEPEESLVFRYHWNRRNVYDQKVYGKSEARVSIGYQYRDCGSTIWTTHTTSIRGYPVDISHVGGWNLNIQHHFNPFQGKISLMITFH